MIPAFIPVIFIRILWLMLAYTFIRWCFYLNNYDMLVLVHRPDILRAFIHGLRFDLAAVLYSNAPLLLMWTAPLSWQMKTWWGRLEWGLFLLSNLFFIGLNVLDVEYYKFTGKRMSLDIFNISSDLKQHTANILATYWKLVVLWLATTLVVAWLCRRTRGTAPASGSWMGAVAWRVALVAAMVVGMRGGTQLKPVSPMNAYFTTSAELGALTLNTPFNFIKSKRTFEIPECDFFPDESEVGRRMTQLSGLRRPPLAALRGWNVVVIIVESFATEYRKYAPFFNSLAAKAYDFEFNYANGRRSIEALPSILCGLPSLMDEPIVSSDFNNNEMHCLAHVLSKAGYSTHFYHGAYNGSMYMDTFSKRAGFENFVGFDEFPPARRAKADDHVWGILDEPMFAYAVEQMDQAPRPFLLGLFTLSSHHPYYIPRELRNQFPDGTLEIHKSIGYADYALKKFFEQAEKSDWFPRTVFIITGDHIQKSDQPEYRTEVAQFRVPLLIYAPGLKSRLPFDAKHITQHIDIQPTLFDLLGIQPEHQALLGVSAFDNSRSYAFNYGSAGWWMLNNEYVVKVNRFPQSVQVFRQEKGLSMIPDESLRVKAEEDILNLKAVVQYTLQGIVKNKIYRWKREP